jgi:hypothetical protein
MWIDTLRAHGRRQRSQRRDKRATGKASGAEIFLTPLASRKTVRRS